MMLSHSAICMLCDAIAPVVVWVLNSQGSGDRTRASLTPVPESHCEASDVASIQSLDETKTTLGHLD
jgi:hypothetical protein